jgi:hypothetical protein
MTRTIEQILGLTPMNQFDLTASPMSEIFIDNPPAANFLPWTHVANGIPLNQGVTQKPAQPIPPPKTSIAAVTPAVSTAAPTLTLAPPALIKAQFTPAQPVQTPAVTAETPAVKALRAGWMKKKAQVFAGKQHIPDSEDPDTVNHLDWYESTNFTRPYPGETKVRPASDFKKKAPQGDADGD